MIDIQAKILEKITIHKSLLYQTSDLTNDYSLDLANLWIPYSKFLVLQHEFPYFSSQPLISGILFSKSKKTKSSKWFRAKFYSLYKDHMVLYSVISSII